MSFDFETIIDRRGKDSIAADRVNFSSGTITNNKFSNVPMWVADMGFATPQTVTNAIMKRLEHPIFGYFEASDDYYDAIINWQKKRHCVTELFKTNIAYENSVLGGLISAVNCLTSRGGSVLINSPTYIGFTSALTNNGYNIVLSPLKLDDNGIYRLDIADMEEKIVDNNIHTAIFCSPHNPCGRVWERRELEEVMELYKRHDVFVISDEIWSDIVLFNNKHIPLQTISEDAKQRTVALYAPTKTFNLAGLVGSYHIIYSKYLIDRIKKEASLSHYNEMNVLSMHALVGAYTSEGAKWVDELCNVLSLNAEYACNFVNNHFEGVKCTLPQGTYMLFLDCTEWCKANNCGVEVLLNKGFEIGVIWQDGRPFHGDNHIRVNLALPHSQLCEAFDRLDKYVF